MDIVDFPLRGSSNANANVDKIKEINENGNDNKMIKNRDNDTKISSFNEDSKSEYFDFQEKENYNRNTTNDDTNHDDLVSLSNKAILPEKEKNLHTHTQQQQKQQDLNSSCMNIKDGNTDMDMDMDIKTKTKDDIDDVFHKDWKCLCGEHVTVNVQSRTWPGINQPGGVGRITKYNAETGTYNVKYILGGSEKNIDRQYIQCVASLMSEKREVKPTTLFQKSVLKQQEREEAVAAATTTTTTTAAATTTTVDKKRRSIQLTTKSAASSLSNQEAAKKSISIEDKEKRNSHYKNNCEIQEKKMKHFQKSSKTSDAVSKKKKDKRRIKEEDAVKSDDDMVLVSGKRDKTFDGSSKKTSDNSYEDSTKLKNNKKRRKNESKLEKRQRYESSKEEEKICTKTVVQNKAMIKDKRKSSSGKSVPSNDNHLKRSQQNSDENKEKKQIKNKRDPNDRKITPNNHKVQVLQQHQSTKGERLLDKQKGKKLKTTATKAVASNKNNLKIKTDFPFKSKEQESNSIRNQSKTPLSSKSEPHSKAHGSSNGDPYEDNQDIMDVNTKQDENNDENMQIHINKSRFLNQTPLSLTSKSMKKLNVKKPNLPRKEKPLITNSAYYKSSIVVTPANTLKNGNANHIESSSSSLVTAESPSARVWRQAMTEKLKEYILTEYQIMGIETFQVEHLHKKLTSSTVWGKSMSLLQLNKILDSLEENNRIMKMSSGEYVLI